METEIELVHLGSIATMEWLIHSVASSLHPDHLCTIDDCIRGLAAIIAPNNCKGRWEPYGHTDRKRTCKVRNGMLYGMFCFVLVSSLDETACSALRR